VASWFNPWPVYMQSMSLSPHIKFSLGQDFPATMAAVLAAAGIPKDKVILLPPLPHFEMARVYKNSDVGLFPNRCEGGTNLVLMEYMACGKPAIASNSTGHRDVAGPYNTLLLERMRPLHLQGSQGQTTVWDDPDLEELTEKLLWAYDHPAETAAIGQVAGRDMEAFTWEAAAKRFYQIAARAL